MMEILQYCQCQTPADFYYTFYPSNVEQKKRKEIFCKEFAIKTRSQPARAKSLAA